ncbi:hypothetical protein TWF569_001200 [Orbilia oligospora]|uniref:DUF2423 domain-containing protein n=1 Tax=Orbilia oligospora TaxID=2813651 RepID=A0A7C8JVP1_ORBOL|nr:hypothetical protein TWF102_002134 [Orbilia oligospora]KAF3084260.1 hypothetical protein TWF103_002561 [Orbilia oligospora]KAF3118580.1 hypothetical protein TWF703_004808 [Orbilia oligospora]KAF3124766.1 hypothetical protein TWF569_001200 [Orbilia oligospora]KAF3148902.1 hypothetical protein TWF594_000355 [Orbilia oligospora]
MAKSARASTKKASRSRIRNNVYAPVEQARLERLSARLMAIAQPSTSRTTTGGDHMDEDDLADATTRQEQHTEDQAFKAAQQGNLFFDLPLPLSLVDEDSSGDESEDDAFYRAIGLFGDIQGFGMDNTLRVCLT